MNSEINNVEFEANEMKLKKWLESPIETERTNAPEEHDLVV